MARALLRLLLSFSIVCVLAMPTRNRAGVERWWSALGAALSFGLVSSLLAPHRFAAMEEWSTWFVLIVFAWAFRMGRASWHLKALLVAAYLLVMLVLLHATWVSLPVTPGRLRGIFHHPNALSTLGVCLLPLFCWRSASGQSDARLAQLLTGALVCLVYLSGSLTGGLLLAFCAGYWSFTQKGWKWASLLGGLAALAVLAANLAGGWWGIIALPALLLASLAFAVLKPGGPLTSLAAGLMGISFALLLTASLVLAPWQGVEAVGSASRGNSLGARLSFYKAAVTIWLEHPVLGVGPAGFSRHYPQHQPELQHYSKFVHCLPLELGCEWGALALACFLIAFLALGRRAAGTEEPVGRVCFWTLGLLAGHSLTGVQSQFPYLLLLGVLALGAVPAQRSEGGRPEPPSLLLGRIALAGLAIVSIAWNSTAVAAQFDLELARELGHQGERARRAVDRLAGSAYHLRPFDSEVARQMGTLLLVRGEREKALEVAQAAVRLDPDRASCRHLLLRCQEEREGLSLALTADSMNFPDFHRWEAERLLARGDEGAALEYLRQFSPRYQPLQLAGLPEFRYQDLAEQLVEFYGLKAILEERAGSDRAEPDLRLALHFAERFVQRLERLRSYPQRSGLNPGPLLEDFFDQLTEQLAGSQFPTGAAPLDQSQQL